MKKTVLFICAAMLMLSTAQAKKAKKKSVPAAPKEEPAPVVTVTEIRLGITDDASYTLWKPAAEQLKTQDIDLQLIMLNGERSPNEFLAAGEIDLCSFQDMRSLENEAAYGSSEIAPLGTTYAIPLCLCSKKITDIAKLRQSDGVAIPREKEAQGAALRLLAEAGLIRLYDAGISTPSLGDIESNKKGLSFRQVAQAELISKLDGVKAAVLTRKEAELAGARAENILYTRQTAEDTSYWHVLTVRAQDLQDEAKSSLLRKVLQAFQSPQTQSVFEEQFGGAYIPAGWGTDASSGAQ